MNSLLNPAAVLVVALGGAAGSVGRYLLAAWLAPASTQFPWATLLVNVVGAFAIGAFARLFGAEHDPLLRLALTTGLCGGFTTFSAFSVETLTLLQQGRAGRAALYVGLSLVLGLGATTLGFAVARPRA